MDGIAINQLLVLMLRCVIGPSLILVLFRLKSIFGLSLLLVALGVFEYLRSFLIVGIYIEIQGIEVFPVSMVLFIFSLIAKLSSAIMYSFIFWVYVMLIDKLFLKLEMNSLPFYAIFQTLIYRQKHEQSFSRKVK